MAEAKALHSFRDGLNTLSVYFDRVEMGVLKTSTYPLEEIASVGTQLFGMQVVLKLRSGKEAGVNLGRTKTGEALQAINQAMQLRAAEGPRIPCTVVGGSGVQLDPGKKLTAHFRKAEVMLAFDGRLAKINYSDLGSIDIEGPGRQTTNAGIIGGGIGVDGAIAGIGIANLVNALTSETTTNTIIRLGWKTGELFLHTSLYSPDEARLALSHVFVALTTSNHEKRATPKEAPDIASQLERLRRLRDAGELNAAEYQLAKTKMLGKP